MGPAFSVCAANVNVRTAVDIHLLLFCICVRPFRGRIQLQIAISASQNHYPPNSPHRPTRFNASW